MQRVIHSLTVLFITLVLGACSFSPVPKLSGVNVTEKILLNVEEDNLLDVEFYNQNEIHYVTVNLSTGNNEHTLVNLETMETKQFNGLPSPSKKQYVSIEGDNIDQTLCVFHTGDTEPFLKIEIPKRNDFPILDYYWLSEDDILIEGDRLWRVDLTKKNIEVIAESKTVCGSTFFYRADEFPNVLYLGSNQNGFYYYEQTDMKEKELFFVSKDGECTLLDKGRTIYEILFFDGKIFYEFNGWKCANNTKTQEIDAEKIYLSGENQKSILCAVKSTGRLTFCVSDCSSPEIVQIPVEFLPRKIFYTDTSSILTHDRYYNWKTEESVGCTWNTEPSVFNNEKHWTFTSNGKGYLGIDYVRNEEPCGYPPILSFSVKKITIEEIRN